MGPQAATMPSSQLQEVAKDVTAQEIIAREVTDFMATSGSVKVRTRWLPCAMDAVVVASRACCTRSTPALTKTTPPSGARPQLFGGPHQITPSWRHTCVSIGSSTGRGWLHSPCLCSLSWRLSTTVQLIPVQTHDNDTTL